jgi:hypothetical protein
MGTAILLANEGKGLGKGALRTFGKLRLVGLAAGSKLDKRDILWLLPATPRTDPYWTSSHTAVGEVERELQACTRFLGQQVP